MTIPDPTPVIAPDLCDDCPTDPCWICPAEPVAACECDNGVLHETLWESDKPPITQTVNCPFCRPDPEPVAAAGNRCVCGLEWPLCDKPYLHDTSEDLVPHAMLPASFEFCGNEVLDPDHPDQRCGHDRACHAETRG